MAIGSCDPLILSSAIEAETHPFASKTGLSDSPITPLPMKFV
jgi:hypothetical protein